MCNNNDHKENQVQPLFKKKTITFAFMFRIFLYFFVQILPYDSFHKWNEEYPQDIDARSAKYNWIL